MREVCELDDLLDRAQSILIDARNRAELNGITETAIALDEILPMIYTVHRSLTGGEVGIRLWSIVEQDLRDFERAKHELEVRRGMLLDQMAYKSPGSEDLVQGGDSVPAAQRILEAEDREARIRVLKTRITRVETAETLLEPLERRLVSLRYYEGKPWDGVAKELCVSSREALRLRRGILGKIAPVWVSKNLSHSCHMQGDF